MRVTTRTKTVYQTVKQYIADDGTVFESEDECREYETRFNGNLEAEYDQIEKHYIDLPFTGWDSEPDLSNIYILKSDKDYETLRTWMQIKESVDDWYGDDPDTYPAAYLVIGRDTFNVGFNLNQHYVEYLRKSANLISKLLKKVEAK